MLIVINIIAITILALVATYFMAEYTNKLMGKASCVDKGEEISLYKFNKLSILFLILIAIVSGFCAYFISTRAMTEIGLLKLDSCYIALLAAAVIDYKLKIIPNFIPITLVVIRVAMFVYEIFLTDSAIPNLISSLLGCFLCVLILLIAEKISKGGIGKGDIKLIAAIGFVCGVYAVFSMLLIALLLCIIAAVILVILKKAKMKDHLPFGPFIYLGYVIMVLLTLY